MLGIWINKLPGLRARLFVMVMLALIPALGLILYNGIQQRASAVDVAKKDTGNLVTRIVDEQNQLIDTANQLQLALAQLPAIRNRDTSACNELFAGLLTQFTRYISIAAFDARGESFCRAPFSNKSINIADRPHFIQALATHTMTSSGYVISRLTGKQSFFVTNPVLDQSGAVVSVLSIGLDLEWLSKLVSKISLPKEAVITLFDNKGLIIGRYPLAPELIGTPVAENLRRAAHDAQYRGNAELDDVTATPWLHVFSPFGRMEVQAYVDVAIPKSRVTSQANQNLRENIILLLLVSLLAMLATWFGSNVFLLRHINSLVRATRKLAQGQLAVRVGQIHGGAEIEELAQAFDGMAQAMQTKEQQQGRIDLALRNLAQGVQTTSDGSFYGTLVEQLAQALQVDYCYVGRLQRETGEVETIAMYAHGKMANNIRYLLPNTPCEVMFQQGMVVYDTGVRELFPLDKDLALMGVDSYAGMSLLDSNNEVLGCLNILHGQALPNREIIEPLLAVFGARAAAELERLRIEQDREHMINELSLAATAFESQEGMFILDHTKHILRVNTAFCEISGYSIDTIKTKSMDFLLSPAQDAESVEDMWHKIGSAGQWQGEMFFRHRNGNEFPVSLSISPVCNQQGEATQFVVFVQDISERKLAESRIKHMAFHDALTNLPNRALLLDRLQQIMLQLERRNEHGALMFLDLDHFKNINDSLGHKVGDLLLIEVADRLTGLLRSEDTVARLGGDEFIVLVPNLVGGYEKVIREVNALAEKIRQIITQAYDIESSQLQLGVSIGTVIFPEHGRTADDLLRHADLAMYAAKMAGRSAVRFFQQEMQTALNQRLALEGELRLALERDEFELYHQPQIDMTTGRVVGGEALLRWRHPVRGYVDAGMIIPILEETGMILDVGYWVMEEACQVARVTQGKNKQPHVMSINVSPRQFRHSKFVEQVKHILEQAQIAPESVELEVTEGIVIQDFEDTVTKMRALKGIGVRFSIDDFGTGYSSLSYIKRLPLDTLKIDQSFVRDCTTDSNDRAIVSAIINMANSLELDIIAEGVEDQAQLELLRLLGCNVYQGYYYSPAVPVEQYLTMLS